MIEYQFDSLPQNWKVKKLKDVVTFIDNKRIPIKESERISIKGKYPYYGASGIIGYVNDYIFDGDYILLGEDGANILSRSSPLAFRVSGKIWVNNHAHVLVPKDFMDIGFITEFLESISYIKYNTGTAQPKLPQSTCSKIDVIVPPLPEQQKIAEILSTWDEAIEKTERLIAALEARKKGLMQRLLTGQVRFPGFEEEWRKFKLKEICIISAGNSFAEKFQGNLTGEFPFYKVSDMNLEGNNKYLINANNYVSKSFISEQKWKLFIAGTVVFPKVGATIHTNKKRLLSRRSLVDNNVMTVNVKRKDQCDSEYLYYWFLRLNLSKYCNPGALPSIKSKDINNIEITIPEINEQQKISDILLLCDSEIQFQELKLNNIRKQKKGLMQRLLTGEVRVRLE